MHIDILIITKEQIDESMFIDIDYLITQNLNVNKNFSINLNGDQISFDYLIISEFINLKPLIENKKIITNQFFETSTSNLFAIGKIVNTQKPFLEQLNIVLDYIKNPMV